MRPILGLMGMGSIAFTLASCSRAPDTVPLSQILDEYRAQNAALEAVNTQTDGRGIRVFSTRTDDNGETLVSADLDNAATATVVARIADAAGFAFVDNGHAISGRSSLRFRDLKTLDALNLLLGAQGLNATLDGKRVTVALLPRARALPVSDPVLAEMAGTGMADSPYEFRLTSLGVDDAAKMLKSFFQIDIDNGVFAFAAHEGANAVYVRGDKALVRQAISMLRDADRPTEHVFIEALIVELNNELVTDLGAQLSGGSVGKFFDVMLDAASEGSNISFAYDSGLSAGSKAFALAMNILEKHSIARVLSRPYLTTTSGKPATLKITEDRFVESMINTNIDITEVNSGIDVSVTPIVTSRGTILTKFSVSESRFGTVEEDISLRRSTNSVDSSATVASGQTIVIGGLSLETRNATQAGVPGATKVPVVGSLVGHKSQLHEDREVMIFLTPRIWRPGMDIPVSSEAVMRERSQAPLGEEHTADPAEKKPEKKK